ncbi:DUF3592 domain-containing protein [Hymenobacter metallilatus]|uniref:DUF3592 domain-containing protein n=1 Tax=Hymenobacter metallilatus TaxID=2493666 RepID=A0A3R9M3Z5_9BACT|nr:DUF3592 domain-containing protein [Hymenobacter metallilatus]
MVLILLVAAGVATVFVLNYLNRYAETQRRQLIQERWVATSAHVLSAEPFMLGIARRNARDYYCTLQLQYHDQQNTRYIITLPVPDSPTEFLYVVGDELPIWYNPLRPQEIELVRLPAHDGRWLNAW